MSRLRRSLLFVPGDDERKGERAAASGADTLLFDLEDAVVPERKGIARDLVCRLLRHRPAGGPECAVRINATSTPFFADDLAAVVEAGAQALLLPKVAGATDLIALDHRLAAAPSVALLGLIESPAAVLAAAGMASLPARVEALCFGHVDFCREMGLAAVDASQGIALHARQQVALAARALRLAPIDSVSLAVRDFEAFRRDAELGRDLGYDGKFCLHPQQVAIANEVYTPSPEQEARALEILHEWAEALRQGRGVAVVQGKMIDAPVAAAQQRIVERARAARSETRQDV